MLVLQAVPTHGVDIYKLLRARIREASTWTWGNKARTRLKHVQALQGGFIQIEGARGVLVAHVYPKSPRDLFYLAEKFTGRLVAWFEKDLLSINIQFVPEPTPAVRKPRRRVVARRRTGVRRGPASRRRRLARRRPASGRRRPATRRR